MRKFRVGFATALLLHAISVVVAPARAQEFPVQTKILKNGMKVLVQSDHTIPNVALYIFYRIGSRLSQ
jgi:zinc protease